MRIDLLSNDERAKSAKELLDRRHTVRLGALFSPSDTPPDLLVLPIPITRDGLTLNGTPYTLDACRQALQRGARKTAVLGYGACPDALLCTDYRDLSQDERFVSANAELTAEGGMLLLENAFSSRGIALFSSVAVILGYGRIARAMAARLCAHGAHVMIGARRSEAREAARRAGYIPFDPYDRAFFFERGRLLFAECAHAAVNTVPTPSVIPTLEGMPNAVCALELSGKGDVLAATEALPFPALDGKAIPTRFFPKSAGALLAEAILRQKI